MKIDSKKHILIVEDSADLQLLLARMLTKRGYTVSRALNGQEGLDALNGMDELPTFILLDIMMPVMDGFVFRQELQKNPRFASIPVVVMTADSHPESNAEQLRATAFVRKPLDIENLLRIAARLSA